MSVVNPCEKRVASRHRKASFQIDDYLYEAKQAVLGRLFRQVKRDLEDKIKKAFESSFPDWELVEFEVREDIEELGLNEPNRYLLIDAEAKPKRSHPEYEWFMGDDDTENKMSSWLDRISLAGDIGHNREYGPDFRYYLGFGRYRW